MAQQESIFEQTIREFIKAVGGVENVKNALAKLLTNLKEHPVPLPLLSQYMPFQYTMVREGKLNNTPEDLIKARVMYTIEEYTYASHQEELVR